LIDGACTGRSSLLQLNQPIDEGPREDMSFETVLASERVYEGRILNLRVDEIRTPTGVEALREIVENGAAVAVVALDDQQRVLLVKQYRHAVRGLVVEIPAGKLDGDEDPLEGAQRELREETGFRAGHFARLGNFYPAPAWSTEFVYLYLATDLTPGPAQLEADEAIELLYMPLAEAVELIRSGAIIDGKSMAALLLAQQRLNP
jgi:ADP-ribose pyrophosphatase